MKQREITLVVIGAFICGLIWMGLPMSTFSESHPFTTLVFKVIGTITGAASLGYILYKIIKPSK